MSVISDVRHPFLIYDAATLALRLLTTDDMGGGAASSGNVVDGVDSAIKATVFDFTNSNPLAVVLRDTNGDYVSVGGGTQYAEDTAATAAEIVTMAGVVRKDTAASLVDADGDRTELQVDATGNLRTIDERFNFTGTQLLVAATQAEGTKYTISGSTYEVATKLGTDMLPVEPTAATAADPVYAEGYLYPLSVDLSGHLRVALPPLAATGAKQDTGNTSLTSIDGKTPALGQQLAAASSPVVLTAIQVAALTPPAAITGYALEAGHLAAIDTSTAKIPSQGQALAANSLPVVLTAIQVAALTPPAAITGFALEASQLLGNASLTTIAAAVPTAATLDGVTVTYSTDSLQRRIAELAYIQNLMAAMNTVISAESNNSHRMGFELR